MHTAAQEATLGEQTHPRPERGGVARSQGGLQPVRDATENVGVMKSTPLRRGDGVSPKTKCRSRQRLEAKASVVCCGSGASSAVQTSIVDFSCAAA